MKLVPRIGLITSWLIGAAMSPVFIPLLVATVLIARYKRQNLKPKVLWGHVPIINIKYNSQAIRDLGYESDTIVYTSYDINERKDFDVVIRIFKNIKLHFLSIYIVSYPIFLYVLLKYDIFHFYFNGGYLAQTPFRWFELPILKFARKKIVVSPYGGDVTQPSKVKDKYRWNIAMFYEQNYSPVDEKAVDKQVRYFTKYADVVIGVGELLEHLPKYDCIIPMNSTLDLSKWGTAYKERGDIIKIVHAPNHRALKGTQYLIDACDELIAEGYPIELIIVERMRNEDAKKIYEQADIIADQFLIGWYALFAAEGMALGKPVLCYLRENLIFANKNIMDGCPIINTNPDNLKENIKMLIEGEKMCGELGRQGRRYVEAYGMDYVGAQLDKLYHGFYNPINRRRLK